MTTSSGRGGAYPPLVELTLGRLLEFVREPEALFWTFVFPLVMSLALAVAFPSAERRPIVVGLEPGAPHADRVRRVLESVPDVRVRDLAPDEQRRALRDGTVHVIVVATSPPTYRFDPVRQESRLARLVVDDALGRAEGAGRWTARDDPVRVPGSRYVDWLIPGLIGMGIMTSGLWGIGFPIVQARLRKLLKRLVASPMRRRDYLCSQVLARMLFLPPEAGLPLLFGAWAFDMPIQGSLAAIAAVVLAGGLSFGGLALLLASRARTIEAISGLVNLFQLPMWIVSGVFFSASNFPAAFQPVIQALPLTALIDALRAVVLEGATLLEVKGELALLAAWGVVPFFVALRLFRWR